MKEVSGLIGLHRIFGAGWHLIDKLVRVGWTPDQEVMPYLDMIKEQRVPAGTYQRIKKTWNQEWSSRVIAELQMKRIEVMTVYDADYPELLREIPQPPWVLYLRGDRQLLNEACFAMVGTRKPTPYGRKITKQLAEQFVQAGLTVVSGMATGIDGDAHHAVLESGGKTIAVLGTGIDVVYPKNHVRLYEKLVQKGLVISESPPGTGPNPGLFPQRNRIISGLSLGTVVVEAAERSGSLITAECSMEQGREVFAVPGPATSAQSGGTIQLIQQGAKCIRHIGDVLEEYAEFATAVTMERDLSGLKKEKEMLKSLTEHEKILYRELSHEPISLQNIMDEVGQVLSISQIHPALLMLEMKQLIQQLPGNRYIRI
ncbi:DNA processing protein [Croceifilum oryzae]|uniref:DNA processing protein n=1 Tax=Croceifilum oryzae TaxID=1553429 RepID=A0AAJ1WSC2_9BACL|nr:DNA-processing protein DprA [Croceifilum oryzae]MDQ0416863.1 DNA processing protein [Croceifilum oryzae]